MGKGKSSLGGFLRRLEDAFARQDAFALRELGNRAIEEAALANNRLLAEVALIAYCLHKLCSKQHIVRHGKWASVRKAIEGNLGRAVAALEKGNKAGFEKKLRGVIGSIQLVDRQLGNYVQGLYEKAKVKYASNAYALGLGLGQSAALTGADKKDLLRYIGVTKLHDREAVTLGIRERLERLRKRLGE